MFLDTNKMGDERVALDRRLELSGLTGPSDEPMAVSDVRLRGWAERGEEGVDLEGRLTARVELNCCRCLEPHELAITSDFVLNIVDRPAELGPGEVQIDERDTTLFHAEGGKADLRAIATEQIYLNLPLKPVCRAECKGLCPTCGGNRNRIECACRREVPDPRLAALLDLKRRMGDP